MELNRTSLNLLDKMALFSGPEMWLEEVRQRRRGPARFFLNPWSLNGKILVQGSYVVFIWKEKHIEKIEKQHEFMFLFNHILTTIL